VSSDQTLSTKRSPDAPNDGRGALTPTVYRVIERVHETNDVTTLLLEPHDEPLMTYRCGQFNMLSSFGVGEIAISLSSAPGEGVLRHSVRDVGAVSHALCQRSVGDVVGVRGPFGSDWRVDGDSEGADVRDTVLVGAREPSQIVFTADLDSWEARGAKVLMTVDRASPSWTGRVGLVTSLLADAGFDPEHSRAMLCGPEIMMRFTARTLVDLGMDPEGILVSLERNMQCGIGWCGHCQLGPFLLCRDGPVVPYAGLVSQLLTQREL
jgi:anaerobic sulfite reductase subunit B